MIESFIHSLRIIGLDLDASQVAETLWLALEMRRADRAKRRAEGPSVDTQLIAKPKPDQEKEERQRAESSDTVPPPSQTDQDDSYLKTSSTVRLFSTEGIPPSDTVDRAVKIRVPGISALPEKAAIELAFRPFARRRQTSRYRVVDEAETVRRFAENRGRILEPVFRLGSERWFEIVLVVEAVDSSDIWAEMTKELYVTLRDYGSFRDVRLLELDSSKPQFLLRSRKDVIGPLDSLQDVTGRHLVVIVSDCTSEAWWTGKLPAALHSLSAAVPLVLLQLLPESLWERTFVGSAEARVSTLVPGVSNLRLKTVPPEWDYRPISNRIPLPVVTFEAERIAIWAKAVMAVGGFEAPAVLLDAPTSQVKFVPPWPVPQDVTPDERVQQFAMATTPQARLLATYFSAASPLILPIMRLVQRAMLPASTPHHLAEVFLGGIIERITPRNEEFPAEEIAYDFVFGVREILQTWLLKGEAMRILRLVGEEIEKRVGGQMTFAAIVGDESRAAQLPEGLHPFAEISRSLLRRLGAEKESVAVDSPPVTREEASGTVDSPTALGDAAIEGIFEFSGNVRQVSWAFDNEQIAILHDGLIEIAGMASKDVLKPLGRVSSEENRIPEYQLRIHEYYKDADRLSEITDFLTMQLVSALEEGGQRKIKIMRVQGLPNQKELANDRTIIVVFTLAKLVDELSVEGSIPPLVILVDGNDKTAAYFSARMRSFSVIGWSQKLRKVHTELGEKAVDLIAHLGSHESRRFRRFVTAVTWLKDGRVAVAETEAGDAERLPKATIHAHDPSLVKTPSSHLCTSPRSHPLLDFATFKESDNDDELTSPAFAAIDSNGFQYLTRGRQLRGERESAVSI